MSKKGKVLQGTERSILYRVITFFEEEKKKKLAIKPVSDVEFSAMKKMARLIDPSLPASDEPTKVEQRLLDNEKKYQALLKPVDSVLKRAAAATGISERTLRRIKVEANEIIKTRTTSPALQGSNSPEPSTSMPAIPVEVILSTPKRKPPRKRLEIDDSMISAIRNIIEESYTVKKEVPSLRQILVQAKRDFNFPGQKGTLWRIIKSLGYDLKKNPKKVKCEPAPHID